MALMGERLKSLRERRRMTQEELAAKTGLSVRLLQKYEKNESDPSLDNATKLAEVLETTVDYLGGRVPDYTPYINDGLSTIERLIIRLFRSRQMPPHLERAINEALSNELQQPPPAKNKTAQNPQS